MDAMSGQPATRPRRFQFVAGALCLDFCNTVGSTRGKSAREYLNSYADLVAWSEQAGLLIRALAEALARRAAGQAGDSSAALKRATELREAIYRIFTAILERRNPPASDLARLNEELSRSLGRLRVAPSKRGFTWAWARDPESLEAPLGPIARSAAELLTSAPLLSHLRQCAGDTCGWLFIDATKNHSRRWCDMRDCGNRAKVRRHRLRQRRAKGGGRR